MRKLFYFFGIFTAVLVVCGAVGIFWLARSGGELDASSKAYADNAVIAIATDWNKDELWKRASPGFKHATKLDDIGSLFDAANGSLGKLVEYQGAEGQATIWKSVGTAGSDIRAEYVARGKFEKAQATLQITLRQVNNVWMIDGFHIGSVALMRRLTGQPS